MVHLASHTTFNKFIHKASSVDTIKIFLKIYKCCIHFTFLLFDIFLKYCMCSKCTISCHEGVGYYTFPLDHSVLVQSVTWVAIGTYGPTCGVHDNMIDLRSMARFSWRDISGV